MTLLAISQMRGEE